MKKLLSIILAAIMLAVCFASCGKTEVTTANAGDSTGAVTEPAGLPSSEEVAALGFAGDFNILVSGNYVCNDFDSKGFEELPEPTLVQTAIYERNEALKADYSISVITEDVQSFGSTTGSGTGFQKLYTEYMSGTSVYDAASIGTYDVATLAYSGLLWDLNKIPHVQLQNDYWDQKANSDLSVLGKLYFTSGDIGIVNNKVTHAILFNKNMIEEYGMEDPYALVKSNNWTWEKLTELVKQVGEDKDQNGIYDANDLYGLMTWKDPSVAILSSSGEKIAGVNEKGEIEYTLMSERVVDLYDQYSDLVYDQAHTFNYQYDNATGKQAASSTWDTNRNAIFNDSRALFYLNTIATIEKHRDSDVEFGVLPYPKLTVTQEEFGHGVSPYHSQFVCIPLMSKNASRSGLVFEYLAIKGQEILRPAYYDITLEGKSVRDAESAKMLDIIFATRVFDLGAYYNVGKVKDNVGNMTISRQTITNIDAQYSVAAEEAVKTLNEAFAKLKY